MTKRLFQITDTAIRKPVPDLYFGDKVAAKRKREELNKLHGTTLRFVVSPGPDHYKGALRGNDRSHPRR